MFSCFWYLHHGDARQRLPMGNRRDPKRPAQAVR